MPKGMFLENIRSEGLSHLSWMIGHKGSAAVIDPRRDCRVYIDMAAEIGASIDYIFETHRNEDYLVGSRELSHLTGAEICHGGQLDFQYGRPVAEGDSFELGDLRLDILETPGHTFESISISATDLGTGDAAVAVFTGDALFVGDVGRTDFFPDRAEEVAGLLYDSIFEKILPLGDQAILLPAHGAGSVCGAGMADREFSTLGMERRYNQALQQDKEAFIRKKIREEHDKPPYFPRMEALNKSGETPAVSAIAPPRSTSPNRFAQAAENGAVILDVRTPEAMGGALIPDSLGIPLEMLPAFAGWMLDFDRDIILVVNETGQANTAFRYLTRIGYDRIPAFLNEGLHTWETTGRPYQTIPSVHVSELVRRINDRDDFTLLDVRKKAEFQTGRLPGAVHLYVGQLPNNLDRIPKDKPVVTFCGSGKRAAIAATVLKRNGFEKVENCLGSMAACAAAGCPVIGNGD